MVQRHVMPLPEPVIAPHISNGPTMPHRNNPKLRQELKHSAIAVEALGILINYLVFDLDAFSAPILKKAVDNLKVEIINTKQSLDEALENCRHLSEAAEIAKRHKEFLTHALVKKWW